MSVFSAIHPEMAVTPSVTSEKEKKEKKEIRQAGILVAVDSTDHYTNEDVVLSSPSPRKRENTSTFRELNLDLSVLTTSGLLRNLDDL